MPLSLKTRYDVHSANHVGRVVCFSLDLSMYLFLSKNGLGIPVFGFCPSIDINIAKGVQEYTVVVSIVLVAVSIVLVVVYCAGSGLYSAGSGLSIVPVVVSIVLVVISSAGSGL